MALAELRENYLMLKPEFSSSGTSIMGIWFKLAAAEIIVLTGLFAFFLLIWSSPLAAILAQFSFISWLMQISNLSDVERNVSDLRVISVLKWIAQS